MVGKKYRKPSWLSWDIASVKLQHSFFDENNHTGYLANWKAVLRWMGENPHILESPLSHPHACDILLTIGLTLRAAKSCAEAEPEDLLGDVKFELKDLDEIQEVVSQMLTTLPSKKLLKFGVSAAIHHAIDSTWKKPVSRLVFRRMMSSCSVPSGRNSSRRMLEQI